MASIAKCGRKFISSSSRNTMSPIRRRSFLRRKTRRTSSAKSSALPANVNCASPRRKNIAHVTYFFNGGIETPFPGEDRNLIPSPKVATYDLKPEMSAFAVTDELLVRDGELRSDHLQLRQSRHGGPYRCGRGGDQSGGDRRCMLRPDCLETSRPRRKSLITADHGNCELMRNPDGSPNTAHTSYLVHVIYVARDAAKFRCEMGFWPTSHRRSYFCSVCRNQKR